MNTLSLTFIIIPFTMVFIDLILKKYNKFLNLILILLQTTMLSVAFYILYVFYIDEASSNLTFRTTWITFWNIDFFIKINSLNAFIVTSILIVFLIILIQEVFTNAYEKFKFSYLLIQASLIATIISYDLILKLFFWELSWLPVIIILTLNKSNNEAIRYSKIWFYSQFFIISSLILLSLNQNFTFNIGSLINSNLENNYYNLFSFIFITIGISIRLFIYPFDTWIYSFFKKNNHIASSLVLLVIPLATFSFFIEFYKLTFINYIQTYSKILTNIFFLLIIPPLLKLFFSKDFKHIIIYLLIVLNPYIIIWVINADISTLFVIYELIYVKLFISLAFVLFSKLIIEYAQTNYNYLIRSYKLTVTLFFSSVLLLYGIPGITLIKPFVLLFNHLASHNALISILMFLIILLSFIYIFNKILPIMIFKERAINKVKEPLLIIILNTTLIIIAISLSIFPNPLHKITNKYFIEVNINK